MTELKASDVREALANNCNSAELEDSELVDGVRASVAGVEAGKLYGALRSLDLSDDDYESRRIGDTIVAHIPAEREQGLSQLFA